MVLAVGRGGVSAIATLPSLKALRTCINAYDTVMHCIMHMIWHVHNARALRIMHVHYA